MRTHRILSANLKGTAHTACGKYGQPLEEQSGRYLHLTSNPDAKHFLGTHEWDKVDCRSCLSKKRN